MIKISTFCPNKKLLLLAALMIPVSVPVFANKQLPSFTEKLAELEDSSGGRIGITAINTGNGMQLKYRPNERFPVGCTAKVIAVSAILKKSVADNTFLKQKVTYTQKDFTNWMPITEQHVGKGMTIAELGAASISYSDNTAMNLLAEKIGGPQGITKFARSIGDNDFRLDHGWPEEAMSGPGDLTDSSTPAAMAKTLQHLALGKVLPLPQRNLLQSWLINNTTGDKQIRAGVPKGWVVGDKTGKGFHHGTTNDIGIIWPPKCNPIIVAIYYTNNKKDAPKRDDIIAAVTRLLLSEFARTDRCIKLALTNTTAIPVTRESTTHVLNRLDIPKSPYRVGVGVGKLAPNTLKPWHSHTGPEMAYIFEGTITITSRGEAPKIYTAGQSYEIPPGVIHQTQAGPKGASYMSVWAVQKGKEDQFTIQAQ